MIVNLATNARDAMPNGGKLVIETANVDLEGQAGERLGMKPGPCVMLAVSDNGIGMDPETRSRLFEPFFTTKAAGEGQRPRAFHGVRCGQAGRRAGDGLQPAQLRNDLRGLPAACAKDRSSSGPPARPPMGSETILLVDDEEGVRKLCCAVLQANGYHVLEADNGQSALAAYEKNAHKVDMLLTDVDDAADERIRTGARAVAADSGAEDPLHVRISRQLGGTESGAAAGRVPAQAIHAGCPAGKVREVLDAERGMTVAAGSDAATGPETFVI